MPVTLRDDRRRLRPFVEKFGHQQASTITPGIIRQYLETIPPGSNRRSIYKTLRKLWKWAFELDHIGADPLAKIRPMDDWGTNDEIISADTFRCVLRVCAGLEVPRENMKPTKRELEHITRLKKILPFFVGALCYPLQHRALAFGYCLHHPADRLAGHHLEIFAARDKKLDAARQNRKLKRQQLTKQLLP